MNQDLIIVCIFQHDKNDLKIYISILIMNQDLITLSIFQRDKNDLQFHDTEQSLISV